VNFCISLIGTSVPATPRSWAIRTLSKRPGPSGFPFRLSFSGSYDSKGGIWVQNVNEIEIRFYYWCIILTIDFGKPNSTFHLLSKKCPKSNLNTTFITVEPGVSKLFGKRKKVYYLAGDLCWKLYFWKHKMFTNARLFTIDKFTNARFDCMNEMIWHKIYRAHNEPRRFTQSCANSNWYIP
jgi:hypothetical protein